MPSFELANSGVDSNRFRSKGGQGASLGLTFLSVSPVSHGKPATSLPDKLPVGEATAHDVAHPEYESLHVAQFPVIVPEALFIQIPEQVERLDRDVRSLEAALQKTPEVLHAVGMNVPVHVLNRMVNHLVPTQASLHTTSERP